MQLGISTYSFPWGIGIKNFNPPTLLSPHDLLNYAAAKNIRVVQFGDNYPLHTLNYDQLHELIMEASRLHINIQVGARKLTVDNILSYIPIALELQTDFIRIVIDDDDYFPTESAVIHIINELVPYLQRTKLVLALENHDRFPAQTLKNIIESSNRDHVAICLDTANSLGAGEGLGEVLAVLAPYTINLHIKDFIVRRLSHKMGFRISGCIAGTGMLDIPFLVGELSKYGRCHTAILELWSDPEATMEETIEKERQSVEKSIDYLKTFIP